MYEEYFRVYSQYKAKYGPKTFLLYQVGAFFEIYAKKSDSEMNAAHHTNIHKIM